MGALTLFDFTLIDAARTLGCNYPQALMRVLVPALAPAFLTSGMFAFLASMDNYPISIFFTDAWTKTLPIQMLQYVEERPDPDDRRHLGGPGPAGGRGAGDRRSAGRPAQARGLLELG